MKAPDDFPKSKWATSGPGGTPWWVGVLLFFAVLIALSWVYLQIVD